MNPSLQQILRNATRLTRAGHLGEATAALQRALRLAGTPGRAEAPASTPAGAGRPTAAGDVIDVEGRFVETEPAPARPVDPAAAPVFERSPPPPPATARSGSTAFPPGFVPPTAPATDARRPAVEPGRFVAGSFTSAAGTRPYKLFVPAAVASQPRPLLVLLHGCKQNPDDFAAGTRMNKLAQAQGWVVLYPGQPPSANGSGCWNWFQSGDQQRERGEPAILAGMTRHILATESIDPQRVYVAGLSAGGAMAAVLAGTHPDLFAAVGIHSGLPHAAAHDLMTALSVMRQGPSYGANMAALPAIVFHGDRDQTVHPSNGEALVARGGPVGMRRAADAPPRVETGRVPGGHRYTRSLHLDPAGQVRAEYWLVHGAGHAWFGGSSEGSYTDPRGPDASTEMLRFFTAYRVAGGAVGGAM